MHMRNLMFTLVTFVVLASACSLESGPPIEVADAAEPDVAGVVPANPLTGHWKTINSHPGLCPDGISLWTSLELLAGGQFVARSAEDVPLAVGAWHYAFIELEDGTTSNAAFLDPIWGAYPVQLNSSDAKYMGAPITVDVPGTDDVCSWMLTLEKIS